MAQIPEQFTALAKAKAQQLTTQVSEQLTTLAKTEAQQFMAQAQEHALAAISKQVPEQVLTVLSKTGIKKVAGAATPAFTAMDVVTAWKDYATTCQVEKTKREGIRADRDKYIASIKAQTEIWRDFIERTFAERKGNFDKNFELLSKGLESGDDRAINAALTMITELIKVSPMKQAAEMMQSLNNPDVKHIEW